MPTRRNLLRAGLAAVPLGAATLRFAFAQGAPDNLVLCLTGIGPKTAPESLAAVAEVFISNAIPLCLVLEGDAPLSPAMETAADLARREPGLVELVAGYAPGAASARYFQMLAAGTLRRRLSDLAEVGAPEGDPLVVPSVFVRGTGDGVDFPAFRSAGFHALLALGGDGEGEAARLSSIGRQQIVYSGGIELDLQSGVATAITRVETLLQAAGGGLLALRVPIGAGPDAELLAGFEGVASRLRVAMDRGVRRCTRPIDLVLRLSAQPPAGLAIVLKPESESDLQTGGVIAGLIGELDRNGLPYTLLRDDTQGAGASASAHCVADGTALAADAVIPPCVVEMNGAGVSEADPARIVLFEEGAATGPYLGSDARLWIPLLRGSDLARLGPDAPVASSDHALLVTAGDVPTELDRAALALALARLRDGGTVRFFPVVDLAEHLVAPTPILARFQSARLRRHSDPPQTGRLAAVEREKLQDDAALAWRYFARHSNEKTGMGAGTVQKSDSGLIAFQQATLWDLGSQVQGIIAAREIGLVDTVEAGAQIEAIFDHVPVQTIDGLRLPPLFLSTDSGEALRRGFDLCDTARMLIALASARDAGLVSEAYASKLFESWDIAATLRDDRPFDHKGGGWVEAFQSHCTPYVRRGLAGWGIEVASPYPEPDSGDGPDFCMSLLHSVAFIGHYTTEPLLLEATELGHSEASHCLSELLFDAQLTSFETTGRLKCVSEISLHEAPWFTYQGLRIDLPGEQGWVIMAANPDPAYDTDGFRAKVEVISAKAAYLWAAHYPHPYTRRLVDLIREKARIEGLGFSIGVFTGSGEAMPGYTDINTNGVILSAIAHQLRNRG
ncbi:DUF3131 domain-containing protein [Maritimibacter sp. HL-12]|uniref:DUF3131 domain-containing protein n=1 Tax=Maritimibacter sp. HL-12 TaxID=1162418 RepID=UPI000A0EF0FA|nr:DUF3131 domain-containing protein [Maritimibacter sp. HL-12]SMH36294.1 Protein of unknown function [Maritimibacter sp. HL-12]